MPGHLPWKPCLYTQDDRLVYNNGVELIGKINPDMSVKVLTSWDLGPDVGELRTGGQSEWDSWLMDGRVDYKVADAVVDATHRYKELFYES